MPDLNSGPDSTGGPDVTDPTDRADSADQPDSTSRHAVVVDSRPLVVTRVVASIAAVVGVGFAIIAITLPHATAGASITAADQFAMLGMGVFVVMLILLPSRPRVRADQNGIRARSFLGGYRELPWSDVRALTFTAKSHWPHAVLDADEEVALFGIQRADGSRSVAAMQTLRQLHAQSVLR
jgi:hypothetical protein